MDHCMACPRGEEGIPCEEGEEGAEGIGHGTHRIVDVGDDDEEEDNIASSWRRRTLIHIHIQRYRTEDDVQTAVHTYLDEGTVEDDEGEIPTDYSSSCH